jgi:hypothetical protein
MAYEAELDPDLGDDLPPLGEEDQASLNKALAALARIPVTDDPDRCLRTIISSLKEMKRDYSALDLTHQLSNDEMRKIIHVALANRHKELAMEYIEILRAPLERIDPKFCRARIMRHMRGSKLSFEEIGLPGGEEELNALVKEADRVFPKPVEVSPKTLRDLLSANNARTRLLSPTGEYRGSH